MQMKGYKQRAVVIKSLTLEILFKEVQLQEVKKVVVMNLTKIIQIRLFQT